MAGHGWADPGPHDRDTSPLALAVPSRQLADAPLTVRLTGVPVGQVVEIELRARWWSGEVLAARARYRSLDGTVDVSRDAPVDGYDGVDADGLLHTLVADIAHVPRCGQADEQAEPELAADRFDLRVRIGADDGVAVCATTWREAMVASVQRDERLLRGGTATLLSDNRGARHGPVIVAVAPADRHGAVRSAALLASHGYRVALLRSTVARDGLLTLSGELFDAGRAVWSPRDEPSLLVVLDIVADRRSSAATRAWDALLDQLRGLRVAPAPR